MASQCMLTTSDNPWNPITNWDEWYAYDNARGYNTCGYLARIAPTVNDFNDELNDEILEQTIDEIVRENVIRLETDNKVCYMKVKL